jgi:hypothetical protein
LKVERGNFHKPHNTAQPTTDASESAKPVMSDIVKPKAKDCS